jgi:hypothetical protein
LEREITRLTLLLAASPINHVMQRCAVSAFGRCEIYENVAALHNDTTKFQSHWLHEISPGET